jgi:hypothetical protein
MSVFGAEPKMEFSFGLEFNREKVDYYNDGEKSGWKADAEGSFSVSAPENSLELFPIPIGWGVKIIPVFKEDVFTFDASLGFGYDEQLEDPWATPVSGTVTMSWGLEAGVKAQWGPEIANVNATSTGRVRITGSGTVDNENKDIRIKEASIDIGELIGKFKAVIQLKSWTMALWKGEHKFTVAKTLKLIESPHVLYNIP